MRNVRLSLRYWLSGIINISLWVPSYKLKLVDLQWKKNEKTSRVFRCFSCSTRRIKWQVFIVESSLIASHWSSRRIFQIFNTKWSYDKLLIGWIRSSRTCTNWFSVRRYWPRAKYFPSGPPTQSISTYYVKISLQLFAEFIILSASSSIPWRDRQHSRISWYHIPSC